MMNTANGKARRVSVFLSNEDAMPVCRTVAQDELPNAGDDHGNRSEEVIIGTETDKGERRNSSLELAQRQDR